MPQNNFRGRLGYLGYPGGTIVFIFDYLQRKKISYNLILQFDVEDSFNNYKPFIKVTCNGITYNVVYNSFGSMKIKFGISKTVIKSTEDCTCGFNDCLNVSITYFKFQEEQIVFLFSYVNILFSLSLKIVFNHNT